MSQDVIIGSQDVVCLVINFVQGSSIRFIDRAVDRVASAPGSTGLLLF
jgi:hypothetical protein